MTTKHQLEQLSFEQLISLIFLMASDLEGTADVLDHHIMEAIAYRNLDRPTYLGSNV